MPGTVALKHILKGNSCVVESELRDECALKKTFLCRRVCLCCVGLKKDWSVQIAFNKTESGKM